jgi:SAM-dependent methyltransferase
LESKSRHPNSSSSKPAARPHLFIPQRHDQPELLDLGHGSAQDVAQSLNDLWRINRYLGGVRSITNHLFPRLRQASGEVSLLDLGAGSGHMLRLIARWADRRKVALTLYGLDLAERHLHIAAQIVHAAPNITLVQGDALAPPVRDQGVDYAISSLFIHHLGEDDVVKFLRISFAKARRGIIFSDLERGWLPYAAFKGIQPVFARSYLTRHDGAASVRRAYTPAELLRMAHAADLPKPKVFRHIPWRMTLVAERDAADV